MDAVAITVQDVSKRYPAGEGGEFLALSHINLDIRPGEFLSLIGPSGCGKTTLLKMLSGLIPVEEGAILYNGSPVRDVPPDISFVFQDIGLLPWRSVRDNVELGLSRQLPPAERHRIAQRYLEMMGLKDFAGYRPYQLSGGMQQRVGLARALAVEPKVLFMDEPFGALDALTRGELQRELCRIHESTRVTVVFVTHDVDESILLSDRIAVFGTRPGRILETLRVPLDRPRLAQSVRGNLTVAQFRDRVMALIEQQIGAAAGR